MPKWNDTSRQTVGRRFKAAREDAKLTQEEVGKEIGISSVTLGRYEKGERLPQLDDAHSLARLYEKSLDYFVFDVDMQSDRSPNDDPENPGRMSGSDEHARIESIVRTNLAGEQRLIRSLTREIALTAKIAVIAVFKYDWPTDRLIRIPEHIDESVAGRLAEIEELYVPSRGLFITDRAWKNKSADFRLVKDYDDRIKTDPSQVRMNSYLRHEKLLGAVISTMYADIGTPDQTYLLRCFNRSDVPDVLLDRTQYDLLNELCRTAGRALTARLITRRLDKQMRLWQQALRTDISLEDKLEPLLDLVYDEDMGRVVVLWNNPKDGDQYTEAYRGAEDALNNWLLGEWFYSRTQQQTVPFVLDLFQLSADSGAEAMLPNLRDQEIGHVLVFPFQLQERKLVHVQEPDPRKGAMVFPLQKGAPEVPSLTFARLQEIIPDKLEVLNTSAAIAGSIIRGPSTDHAASRRG